MMNELTHAIKQLRETKPLILCLTNYVTMDFMANSLLALGAAPIMTCEKQELKELIGLSHAVVINIGTLTTDSLNNDFLAAEIAQQQNKPIVFDPVGAGASHIRTDSALQIMEYVNIIRCNASEIKALVDDSSITLGVESRHTVSQVTKIATDFSQQQNKTIVISGEKDFITSSIAQTELAVGSPLMPFVTGMGCALTAVIAAFRGVIDDDFKAAVLGTAYFGLCGNIAQKNATAPASFRTAFIDQLYYADIEQMTSIYFQLHQ